MNPATVYYLTNAAALAALAGGLGYRFGWEWAAIAAGALVLASNHFTLWLQRRA